MEDKETWKVRLKNIVADDRTKWNLIILVVLIVLFLGVVAMNFTGPAISNVFNNIDDCPSDYALCGTW